MGPEAWKRHIGVEAWDHIGRGIIGAKSPMVDKEIAKILTNAAEIGFLVPGEPPRVHPDGTKVLWPNGSATTTAEGLLRWYESKGHGFFLLRVPQLLRACASVLMPRLQEILLAYEEQCMIDGVSSVAMDWRGFVGGTNDLGCQVIPQDLFDECPTVDGRKIDRAQVAGPSVEK